MLVAESVETVPSSVESFESEEWRVAAVDPRYRVSSRGRVTGPSGKILSPYRVSSGYLAVNIREKNHYVHHLVATAFIGERPPGADIDHIDGNKKNNRPGNLEYVSRQENTRRAYATGLATAEHRSGERSNLAKLTEAAVRQIRAEYPNRTQVSLAVEHRVTAHAIYQIVTRKTWKHVA